jgi:hypothetical protein
MTRNIFFCSALSISLLAALGCHKAYNYTLDQQVSAVSSLYAPSDSLAVTIVPATGAPVVFQWAAAQAADGSLVQYEVAFDTAGDNFKHPVFTVASDNTGENNQATITASQLNQIAALAGIPSLGTGKVYWTVYSTKGLNLVPAASSRLLILTRPAGFAVIPASLYLTGSATEGGATLTTAIPFKQPTPGVFELYTSLKQGGSYQFVDNNTGTPNSYYMNASGALGQNGTNNYTDTSAQVRFNLDFNNAVGTLTVVRSIDVWYSDFDTIKYHLTYAGNSVWQDLGQVINAPTESWGLEDRYKFQFTVNYGGGTPDGYEFYGSSNSNNNEPTSTSPASYYYLFPVTSDQWDYTFKFDLPTENLVQNNITVTLQPTGPYTHSVVPQ